MYENPGDDLYFGEVYRTVLQEAWLPEGAEDWQRTGKSRRGRRPTQQGLLPRSPTQEQAAIRACFAQCIAAWNALPWDNPNNPPCDARWGKEYWKKEKDDRGVPCSYYDLFMRYCLRHCLDTTCTMPSAYTLIVSPELKDVEPSITYDISISGNCGQVTKISGPGTFIPPGEWVSPSTNGSGTLGFQDENGAKGCTTFVFKEVEFFYDENNPVGISAEQEIPIRVIGGTPPFDWSSGCPGTSFEHNSTESRTNTLIAEECCKGTGDLTVTDDNDLEVSGPMEASSEGVWVFKALYNAQVTFQCREAITLDNRDLSYGSQRWLLFGAGLSASCLAGDSSAVWLACPPARTPICGSPTDCVTTGPCMVDPCFTCPPCDLVWNEILEDWVCPPEGCAVLGIPNYEFFFYYEWECV